MISAFDLDKLYGLLKDFYEISHIRITVFDENMNELVSYPNEVASYCKIIRGTQKGFEACAQCDIKACLVAAQKKGPYIYRCHAGLTEAVTPLFVGDLLVGYLLFGHVFSYNTYDEGWSLIKNSCSRLAIDENELKKAVYKAPIIDENHINSAAHILHAVASYLIMERMATLQEDKLAVKLDNLLSMNYTEKISASKLCQSLSIGKTQLYALSNQLYGHGIAEQIRELRMNLAKDLLAEDDGLSLFEIASQCGYSDYNYFITVFTRENGISPRAYQKKLLSGINDNGITVSVPLD
ncbi:MAG TPA: PocR ligand-binding domain-containing protein [Bacilli bacterium]|nr:PocR ligand-binding domain-containing protein [Bacilli bacterium]